LLAAAIDNSYATLDQGIEWRVDGVGGMASGSVGWMYHPWGRPSTLRYIDAEHPDTAVEPTWTKRWFPDAFSGTMGEVLRAVADGGTPSINGRDNLRTMALLEAAYQSAAEGRAVAPSEIATES
jgi:hypothetical protein